jgi:hypothetical protein
MQNVCMGPKFLHIAGKGKSIGGRGFRIHTDTYSIYRRYLDTWIGITKANNSTKKEKRQKYQQDNRKTTTRMTPDKDV